MAKYKFSVTKVTSYDVEVEGEEGQEGYDAAYDKLGEDLDTNPSSVQLYEQYTSWEIDDV